MPQQQKHYTAHIHLQIVQLFDQQQDLSARYTVSLQHGSNHYDTSSFPRDHHLIDLSLSQPILIPHLQPHPSNSPFLKIIVSALQSAISYDTTIDQNVIHSIRQQDQKPRSSRKRAAKHTLSFPLFGPQRSQKGQITITLSLTAEKQPVDKAGQRMVLQARDERTTVFSKVRGQYFKPVVSNFITVRMSSQSEPQNEEEKELMADLRQARVEGFKSHKPTHCNLESKPHRTENKQRSDSFDFKEEEISLIEMRDSNEGKLMTEQELREMGELETEEGRILKLKEEEDRRLEEKKAETEELPEDYRHLFQKISEINRKYAPLERIASQEELSEDFSSPHNRNISRSLHPSDISSQEVDKHLVQAELLLKQLNLYQFAQTLKEEAHPLATVKEQAHPLATVKEQARPLAT